MTPELNQRAGVAIRLAEDAEDNGCRWDSLMSYLREMGEDDLQLLFRTAETLASACDEALMPS